MTKTTKEIKLNENVWLNSLKITARVVFACIVAFFYVISSMFFISPDFDAKIFNFFGFSKAEEACYIRMYEKTGSAEDLYNLVLFEQSNENYQKELYYINVLIEHENYQDFCEKLNESSLAAVSKDMYAYVGDTHAYLINRKVRCIYQSNIELPFEERSPSLMLYIRNHIKDGSFSSSSFLTYVTLVLNDSTITEQQKKETFNNLNSMVVSNDIYTTSELLIRRESEILDAVTKAKNSKNEVKAIILQKALVDFYKASYNFNKVIGAEQKELNRLELMHSSSASTYSDMVK